MEGKRYTVPNNHVIGEYEYVLINKSAARELNYSDDRLSSLLSYDSTEALREALTSRGYNADECVKVVTGTYSDKAVFESQGYFCNVAKYPTVTADEAFMSSFAIVRAANDVNQSSNAKADGATDTSYLEHYDRCMEVIYALNTDVYLRNLLQYGVKGTNYTLDKNGYVVPQETDYGRYNMNLLYTGDIFKAYYSESHSWVEADKINGEEQYKESVIEVKENPAE